MFFSAPPKKTKPQGIDFKIKTIEIGDKTVKLQVWDTAGQERFRTITTAYYRGAMGILLVYDVCDDNSFRNVKKWMRQIEEHANPNVNKVLVGNKCEVAAAKREVSREKGQALADEFGVQLFETSAKDNIMVYETFEAVARDVVSRLEASGGGGRRGGGGGGGGGMRLGEGGGAGAGGGGAAGGGGGCCR